MSTSIEPADPAPAPAPVVEPKPIVVVEQKPAPHIELVMPDIGQPGRRRGMAKSAAIAIGQFFVTLVHAPMALVRRKKHSELVVVYAAHPSFFLWSIILAGFFTAYLTVHQWVRPEICAWIWIWTAVYLLAALLFELNTLKLALWVGIFSLIWLLSKYIESVRNVALLGIVFRWVAGLDPKLDPGTVEVISCLLLPAFFGSVIYMVFNGRKQFTPNGISEFHFGEGNELTDRMGLKFKTHYRDLAESLLTFGGGDLVAYDNQHTVVKRWDNIIGLYWVWPDLDKILHQRSVVETNEDEEGE